MSGGRWGLKEALVEVRERRQEIQDEETVEKIEKYGMDIIQGFASFKNKNTLAIIPTNTSPQPSPLKGEGVAIISAKKIVISTGSHPKVYPIEGIDSKDFLTNETIFEQTDDIKDLVVIGGGYIGCEMAESLASLGVKVTIIQRNICLIPREEEEASEVIEKIFREKGIDICTNTVAEKVVGKKLIVLDRSSGTTHEIVFDKILVSLGRVANVEKLNLEKVGVKYDTAGIYVNKHNRTNVKNIFAIGDCVNGNPQFTHWANNEGRGLVRNILLPQIKATSRNAILPATLYTSIEVARVGKTRMELLEVYTDDDIVSKTIYFDSNDRSKVTKDTVGFVKVHFRRISGKILGATIVGSRAGDMLPILISAMEHKTSAYKLSRIVFSYPTKSEAIKKVCDAFVLHTLSGFKSEAKYWIKDNALQVVTATIWIILAYTFFMYKSMHNLSVEDIAISVYNFISGNPTIGPLIYICLYAIRPVVLFPATFMTFMSGALFGFW